MQRTLFILVLFLLLACSARKEAETGKINFQVAEFSEARVQARDTGKMLLAYFYTEW